MLCQVHWVIQVPGCAANLWPHTHRYSRHWCRAVPCHSIFMSLSKVLCSTALLLCLSSCMCEVLPDSDCVVSAGHCLMLCVTLSCCMWHTHAECDTVSCCVWHSRAVCDTLTLSVTLSHAVCDTLVLRVTLVLSVTLSRAECDTVSCCMWQCLMLYVNSSTMPTHHSSDKLVILAVCSTPAVPSHTSLPLGTRSASANALSPLQWLQAKPVNSFYKMDALPVAPPGCQSTEAWNHCKTDNTAPMSAVTTELETLPVARWQHW